MFIDPVFNRRAHAISLTPGTPGSQLVDTECASFVTERSCGWLHLLVIGRKRLDQAHEQRWSHCQPGTALV